MTRLFPRAGMRARWFAAMAIVTFVIGWSEYAYALAHTVSGDLHAESVAILAVIAVAPIIAATTTLALLAYTCARPVDRQTLRESLVFAAASIAMQLALESALELALS